MKLTRRDAVAALLATGLGASAIGGSGVRYDRSRRETESPLDNASTVVALADVIYPLEVEGIQVFVEEYVSGLPESDQDEMNAAAEDLDAYTNERRGHPFAALPRGARDAVLHEMEVHVATSNPEGEPAERIRYYLVNELLYALFTSPTGSRLVGIDNPIAYPGGYESYRVTPRDA